MLKTPPFLTDAALLFWGWQTGFLFFGAIMALLVEASRVTSARWEFSQADYNRIWNLCAVLFIGVAVYCFASNDGVDLVTGMIDTPAKRSAALMKTTRTVLLLFQWLPVIFLPAIAAQAYGSLEYLDLSTFSWLLRRRFARESLRSAKQKRRVGLNISFVYFGLCLFAACAEKSESPWFYPALGCLIGWASFTQRPRRYSVPVWSAVILMVGVLGFGMQAGLRQVHRAIAQLDSVLFSRFGRSAFDSRDMQTSIGAIGRLNLSGKIMFRLESEAGDFPGYLREASYDAFRSPTWHALHRNFAGVPSETNETSWVLLPDKKSQRKLRIANHFPRGQGLLAVPGGVSLLEELPGALETNRFAAVKLQGPEFLNYVAKYDFGKAIDGPPTDDDQSIPIVEDRALSKIAADLQLRKGMEPTEALSRIAGFFRDRFEYSTYLTADHRSTNETPLARFLLTNRSGHCEYFATAATLLLRKAGVPARYAVGYAVQETQGKRAVVRGRHAHAWCLAYVNGAWQDFDTTPASWSAIEGKHAHFWEPLTDAWSRVWFEFSKWRYGTGDWRRYILWIIAPVVVFMLAGILFRRRSSRSTKPQNLEKTPDWPGRDSEFYRIERALVSSGFERHRGESFSQWLSRLKPLIPGLVDPLSDLLALHYRHRFDPPGLSKSEREALKAEVDRWLASAANGS